jgi:hypothetical protein
MSYVYTSDQPRNLTIAVPTSLAQPISKRLPRTRIPETDWYLEELKVESEAPRVVLIALASLVWSLNFLHNRCLLTLNKITLQLKDLSSERYRGAYGAAYDSLGDITQGLVICDFNLPLRLMFATILHEAVHATQSVYDRRGASVLMPDAKERLAGRLVPSQPIRSFREGSARFVERIIMNDSERYHEDISAWLDGKGYNLLYHDSFFPDYRIPYASALFFDYMAQQYTPSDPLRVLDTFLTEFVGGQYDTLLPDLSSWRQACYRLGGTGHLDCFIYLNRDRPDWGRVSDEMAWGNFAVACVLNGRSSTDRRYGFKQSPTWGGAPDQRPSPDPGRTIHWSSIPGGLGERRPGGNASSRPDRDARLRRNAPAASAPGSAEVGSIFAYIDGAGRCAAADGLGPRGSAADWRYRPTSEARLHASGWWGDGVRLDWGLARRWWQLRQPKTPRTALPPPIHALFPYSFHSWRVLLPGDQAAQILRIRFTADGLSDCFLQVVKLDLRGRLVDIQKAQFERNEEEINLFISCMDCSELIVLVCSRVESGNYTLYFSKQDFKALLFSSNWNCMSGRHMAVDPNAYAWNWKSPDLWLDENDQLHVRIANLGDAQTIGGVCRVFYKSRIDPFCSWTKIVEEPSNLVRKDLSFDGGDIGFSMYTREQCRADALKNLIQGGARACGGFPMQEQLEINIPWTIGDPRKYILLAEINCLNNADPAGIRILTSPSGLPPAVSDPEARHLAMPDAFPGL